MASSNDLASSPGQHTFSASQNGAAGGAQQSNATVHKRTYQACLPCRRRKVRCDLGSVDDPGDPPCQRCRREKKDCVFSETRRKRKADDDGSDVADDYVTRNKRSSDYIGNPQSDGIGGDGDSSGRMMPGFQQSPQSMGSAFDQTRQTTSFPKRNEKAASNRDLTNETAAALFQRPIVQPGDALNMLVHAAAKTENEDQKGGKSHIDRERLLAKQTHRLSSSGGQRPDDLSAAIDPAIMGMQDTHRSKAEADVTAAIQAWSRLRFVQAGWLTAREAISYIDYFYENLAPLSPVSPPDFSDYAEHPRLLEEEPMLTVSLLTIASRYKLLDGPGGATRSFRVHDKLWVYLQGMVTRMFWGQEQFGGGFCGAGGSKTQKAMEAKRRGLRSLGTAESLLLLSDWLPRSMHFNPDDDAGELLVPLITDTDDLDEPQSIGGVHASWTEPAIRSDRMSWSLVGMAYTLSWELGVFDSLLEEKIWCPGPQAKTSYDGERADRIGRMLLVYVSQSCGRLGYPNMMPSQGNETNFNFLKMDVPEGRYPGPYGTITETDKIQRAWAELTALMRQSNTEMFESKTKVSEVIKNGSYIKFLEDWGPRMKEWKDKFEQTQMPEKMRHILRMEWEYARTYIYSVSLQAVVESCAAPSEDKNDANMTSAHTPPALFSSKVVDIHKQNRVYIEELIEAARSVLRIAVENLHPLGVLRHAPVRTHFRILSGAMFLLKSFAVGGKESEVSTSLYLLDKTVRILRESVIDDVHLSLRIADLLSGLTTTIRQKFVRLTVPSRGTKQRPSHAQKPSTSQPTSAPKSGTTSGVRPTATTPLRSGHIQSSQSTATGPNGAATPPGSYGTGQDNWYSSLGLDEAPPLVNLKDENITIMPPPDLSFANQDFHGTIAAPLSPHSSNTAGGLGSPSLGGLGGNRPRNSSFDNPGQMPFTPTQASFSPMSTGSGGYDWLALDFNPLLANGGIHFGPGDQNNNSGSGNPHGQSHNPGAADGMDSQMDHVSGHGDDAHGTIGASPWTMGAFGPEISEGLEMLGALGALVWDPEGQPGGGNPHSG